MIQANEEYEYFCLHKILIDLIIKNMFSALKPCLCAPCSWLPVP